MSSSSPSIVNSAVVVMFLVAAAISGGSKGTGWNSKGLVQLVWYLIAVLVFVDLLVLVPCPADRNLIQYWHYQLTKLIRNNLQHLLALQNSMRELHMDYLLEH